VEEFNNFVFTLLFRQRFIDICENKINRGGITVMKDISSVKKNQEVISNERIVNKIQDILWDDVFEQYFLHPQVFYFFIIIKRIGLQFLKVLIL